MKVVQQNLAMGMRRLARCGAIAAGLLAHTASAEVLSGHEFQNLLAGGPEGTTIVFQGGTDKIFYSPTLKNRLRLAPELGPEFLRQKILQNTITEGVFIGATSRTASGAPFPASPELPPTPTAAMAC